MCTVIGKTKSLTFCIIFQINDRLENIKKNCYSLKLDFFSHFPIFMLKDAKVLYEKKLIQIIRGFCCWSLMISTFFNILNTEEIEIIIKSVILAFDESLLFCVCLFVC